MARFAPIFIVIGYLLMTLGVYFSGILTWPNRFPHSSLLALVLALIASIGFGYVLGATSYDRAAQKVRPLEAPRFAWFLILIGAILNVVAARVYTGMWPHETLQALADQGAVYEQMLKRLVTLSLAERLPIIAPKLLFSPVSICIATLLIVYPRRIGLMGLSMGGLWILSLISFSLLRGTDKEIGELIVFFFAALGIRIARRFVRGTGFRFNGKVVLGSALLVAVVSASILLFVHRKSERLKSATFCVYETACTNTGGELYAKVPEGIYFGLATTAAYLSQGYYGLGLTTTLPFESSAGAASFPLLNKVYEVFNLDFPKRSLMRKVKNLGWDDAATWSTMIPWLASDISFYLVPLVTFAFGFALARTWCHAIYTNSVVGCGLFSLLMYCAMFIPANNQISLNNDLMVGGALLFAIYWLYEKRPQVKAI